MKKLSFLLALASVFISSCKKNYNCTCTYTGTGTYSGQTAIYVIPDATQQQASTICSGFQEHPSNSAQNLKCHI